MSISTDYRQDQHLGFGSNHRLVCVCRGGGGAGGGGKKGFMEKQYLGRGGEEGRRDKHKQRPVSLSHGQM